MEEIHIEVNNNLSIVSIEEEIIIEFMGMAIILQNLIIVMDIKIKANIKDMTNI